MSCLTFCRVFLDAGRDMNQKMRSQGRVTFFQVVRAVLRNEPDIFTYTCDLASRGLSGLYLSCWPLVVTLRIKLRTGPNCSLRSARDVRSPELSGWSWDLGGGSVPGRSSHAI